MCDSEDIPDDDDYEDDYEDEQKPIVHDSTYIEESAALIEESQNIEETVINILDDPVALSMTLRQQYDEVKQRSSMMRQQEIEQSRQADSIIDNERLMA